MSRNLSANAGLDQGLVCRYHNHGPDQLLLQTQFAALMMALWPQAAGVLTQLHFATV